MNEKTLSLAIAGIIMVVKLAMFQHEVSLTGQKFILFLITYYGLYYSVKTGCAGFFGKEHIILRDRSWRKYIIRKDEEPKKFWLISASTMAAGCYISLYVMSAL